MVLSCCLVNLLSLILQLDSWQIDFFPHRFKRRVWDEVWWLSRCLRGKPTAAQVIRWQHHDGSAWYDDNAIKALLSSNWVKKVIRDMPPWCFPISLQQVYTMIVLDTKFWHFHLKLVSHSDVARPVEVTTSPVDFDASKLNKAQWG